MYSIILFYIYCKFSAALLKSSYCRLFRDLLLCSHSKVKLLFAVLSLMSDLLHIKDIWKYISSERSQADLPVPFILPF